MENKMNTENNEQIAIGQIGDTLQNQEEEYNATKKYQESSSFKQQSNMRSELAFQPNQNSKSQIKQSILKTELNTTEMEKKNEPINDNKQAITTYKTTRDQDQQLNSKKWIIVSNFIKKIKKQSSSVRFFQSCKTQIDIIDDKAVYYKYYFFKNTFINEDSTTSRLWRIFQCILLLMYVLYLPIRISFDALHRNNSVFFFFEILPNLAQILHIIIEFNSGFYKNGVVVSDRTKITLHYLKGRFAFDVVLGICWLISLGKETSLWFKVIGMLRIIAFFQFLGEIEQFSGVKEYLGSYFDLIKLGGFIFFCAHLTGCCWYALAQYEQDRGVPITWLSKDFANFDMEDQIDTTVKGYIASFYWAIITMCTVGYGDVGPVTYRERIFAIFICLLASFLFAFSMNAIGEIIKNIRSDDEEFRNKMMLLNLHMKTRKLSKLLQMRVRKYYEYLFLEQKQSNEQGSQMLEDLTPALRDDVLKDIYTNIFNKEKIFKLNFSDKFIDQIYQLAKEKKYGVDEYLYKEKDSPQYLFFILQGEVEILLQNRVVLQTLGEGQFVGAPNFFSDQPYTFKAKTTTFTQFLIIDKKDFIDLLKNNEKDYQSFCQIKDKIIQNQDTAAIGHPCESCQQFGHIFSNCEMIKFNQNKYRSIYKYNSISQVTRQSWKRIDNSCQTLKASNYIQDTINCFYEHMKELKLKEVEEQQVQSDDNDDDNLESFRQEDEFVDEAIQSNEIHIEQIQEEQIETMPNDTEVVNLQDEDENNNAINKLQKVQKIQNQQSQNKSTEGKENSNNQIQFATQNSNNQGLLSQEDCIYEDTQQDAGQLSGCKLINSPQILSNVNVDKFSNKFSISNIESNKQTDDQQSPDLKNSKKRSLFSKKMHQWKKDAKKSTNNKESKRRQSTQINTFGTIEGMKQSEQKRTNYQQSHKRNLSLPLNFRSDILINQKSPISTNSSPTNDKTQKFFTRQDIVQDTAPVSNLAINVTNKHTRRGTNFSVNDTESLQSNTIQNQNKRKLHLKQQGSVILDIIQQTAMKENIIFQRDFQNINEVEQDFDVSKDYEVYFIHNNPSIIIDKINKINRKNKKYQELIKKQQSQKPQKQKNMQFEKKSYNLLNKKTNQSQKNQQQKQAVLQNKPIDTPINKNQQLITEGEAIQETDKFILK